MNKLEGDGYTIIQPDPRITIQGDGYELCITPEEAGELQTKLIQALNRLEKNQS